MRLLFFLLFLSTTFKCMADDLIAEVDRMSVAIASMITEKGNHYIAVVDFTDLQGTVTELGRFLAEEFSVAVAGSGSGYQVIDRTHLKTILKEHKLSASGTIDPQTAKKLGQIAGVDALITGTITPFGDSIRIAVKVLDIETANIIGGLRANFPKTKAITDLLEKEIGGKPGLPSTGNPVFEPKPIMTNPFVDGKGVRITLEGCSYENGGIVCKLSILSDNDIIFNIGNCSLSDSNGNTYVSSSRMIGNESSGKYSPFNYRIIENIKTSAGFTFSNVIPKPDFVAMLTFIINTGGESKTITFRKVPLT